MNHPGEVSYEEEVVRAISKQFLEAMTQHANDERRFMLSQETARDWIVVAGEKISSVSPVVAAFAACNEDVYAETLSEPSGKHITHGPPCANLSANSDVFAISGCKIAWVLTSSDFARHIVAEPCNQSTSRPELSRTIPLYPASHQCQFAHQTTQTNKKGRLAPLFFKLQSTLNDF